MAYDHEQLTNYYDLWRKLGLDQTGDSLFVFYHKKRHYVDEFKNLRGWKESPRIFLIDQESLSDQIYQCLEMDNRVYFWDSTIIDHPRFFTYLWWFDNVKEVNLAIGSLDRLVSTETKECTKIWDCLLGTPRANRIFLRSLIERDAYQKFLLQGSNNHHHSDLPNDWVPGGSHENGNNFPPFRGEQTANIASFIPYDIYNNTWYTIVTETHPNGTQFYTEKTAKPIMSKRLFVMFGPKHALKHLRDLGYSTFDEILDESYDSIDDDVTRWTAAWQQVKYLTTQDHKLVYRKIQPVLDHNFENFMRTNWEKKLQTQISEIINAPLPNIIPI